MAEETRPFDVLAKVLFFGQLFVMALFTLSHREVVFLREKKSIFSLLNFIAMANLTKFLSSSVKDRDTMF